MIEGLRAGAAGYLLKDCSAEELHSAVRTVARGQVLLQTTSVAQLLAGLTPPSPAQSQLPTDEIGLTEREREVLRLILKGCTNAEITKELYISESTVKTHINHIFAKLGARDRAHAILLVNQLHLDL